MASQNSELLPRYSASSMKEADVDEDGGGGGVPCFLVPAFLDGGILQTCATSTQQY
jgi:hypothetical protein